MCDLWCTSGVRRVSIERSRVAEDRPRGVHAQQGTRLEPFLIMCKADYAHVPRDQRFMYVVTRHPLTFLKTLWPAGWSRRARRPMLAVITRRTDAMSDDDESKMDYRVVVNHEEQYSIWPLDRDLPAGWRAAGKTGPKDQCLAYIEEVWTDMRPLSLRQHMAQHDPGGQ